MAERLTLTVNGAAHTLEVDDPGMPLLYALRGELGMNNPRFGCGLGQCGACTVLIDGRAVRSCQTPVSSAVRTKIVTLAGLGTPEHPHPLQTAWIEEQVSQCAYCINGWILTAKRREMFQSHMHETVRQHLPMETGVLTYRV